MENRYFPSHRKRSFGLRFSKSTKTSLFLLPLPACLFTLALAHADTLPPQCHHPYDEPNRVICTYTFTGSEQTFQVPAGVTTLDITAIGAAGASGGALYESQPGAGGKGGQAEALITVTPGSTFYVEVGGTPTTDPARCFSVVTNPPLLCVGGWNGGGSATYTAGGLPNAAGGGGGGASDVRTISLALPGSLDSRLIVAGGGGGGGSSCNMSSCSGGDGGDAGSAGQNGGNLPSQLGGTGGGAGTYSAGGSGGIQGGMAGSLGQGGNGGAWFDGSNPPFGMGAGGGGGYYGGGGGGVPQTAQFSGPGGGGGGSSFVPEGGSTGVSTEPAQVVINYILPPTTKK
jgi:hypothetical protein